MDRRHTGEATGGCGLIVGDPDGGECFRQWGLLGTEGHGKMVSSNLRPALFQIEAWRRRRIPSMAPHHRCSAHERGDRRDPGLAAVPGPRGAGAGCVAANACGLPCQQRWWIGRGTEPALVSQPGSVVECGQSKRQIRLEGSHGFERFRRQGQVQGGCQS